MVNNILSRRSLKAEKEIIEWEEVHAEDIVEICRNDIHDSEPSEISGCYSNNSSLSDEFSFIGFRTSPEACVSYSSTARSTIRVVRTHSFVPYTFTAAWVCLARNLVSG